MATAREKIGRAVEKWFLMEPLFFAVWTTHELVETAGVETIRVNRGRDILAACGQLRLAEKKRRERVPLLA